MVGGTEVGGATVFVLVGMEVAVAEGIVCVGSRVAVAGSGVVGNGLGATRVGRGVEPKPNNAVGVGSVPAAVGIMGLGVMTEALRAGIKRKKTEQAQQKKSKNKPGKIIFPRGPCRL
jgi:hypothetical protein